jgi:multidrug efflux system membrane fusion protein
VTATLTLATENDAITVPSQAVLNGQQGTYVYVAKKDNTAESRQVVVERTSGQEAVIRSGLQPGETVITDGQLRLISGSKLEVKAAYVPASPSSLPPNAPQDPTSIAARDVPPVSPPPAAAPPDKPETSAQRRPNNNKQEAER